MPAAPKISNVNVSKSYHDRGPYAAECHYKGAQYHIWFELQGKPPRPVLGGNLYKNSIAKQDEPGYFHTRKLNHERSTQSGALVKELMRQVEAGKLIAVADAKATAREQRRLDEARKEANINRIKEHGVALYLACKEALAFLEAREPPPAVARANLYQMLSAAVTEAEGVHVVNLAPAAGGKLVEV